MKKVSNLALAVASTLFLAFFSIISCRQAGEKQQEKALERAIEQGNGQKADVDIEDNKVTIESDGGKMEIKTGTEKWPSNIPGNVPELTVGKIIGTTIGEAEGTKSWSVRYQGVEISELDKYAARLKAEGFKITTMKSNQGGMVSGEKGDVMVIFTVAPEISIIAISQQKAE